MPKEISKFVTPSAYTLMVIMLLIYIIAMTLVHSDDVATKLRTIAVMGFMLGTFASIMTLI